MNKIFLGLMLLFTFFYKGQLVLAQDTPVVVTNPQELREVPTLNLVQGQPVEATWTDGRIAELKIMQKESIYFNLNFNITENSCSNKVSVQGFFKNNVKVYKLAWFWKSHPSRSGASLEIKKFSDGFKPFATFPMAWTNFTSKDQNYSPSDMKNDQFSISQLNEVMGLSQNEENFLIRTFLGQIMFTNPETGLNENLTMTTAYNLKYQKMSQDMFQLNDFDYFHSIMQEGFLYGEAITITILKSQNEICEMSLKPNISQLSQELNEYLQGPEGFTSKPYLYEGTPGLDEFLFLNDFESILKFSSSYTNPDTGDTTEGEPFEVQ